MRQCWHADPRERPTFTDITSRIGHRLQKIAAEEYGYLDAVNDYCVRCSCSSHNSFPLQPYFVLDMADN